MRVKVISSFVFALICVSALRAEAYQLFEGSTRRDGNERESRPIVRVLTRHNDGTNGSCTGFFVKNHGNRAFVATARHCARYDLTSACSQNRLRFTTQFGSHVGVCRRVIAAASHLDMAILEIALPNWAVLSQQVHFLRLSSQRARVGTELKMLGYPGDPTRRGRFTVSEGCHVSDGRLVGFNDLSPVEQIRNRIYTLRSAPPPQQRLLITGRRAAFHNCSIYGGNSGGPILVSGTPVVLGMPTAYYPGAYSTPVSSDLSSSMDSTVDLIEAQGAQLRAAGVITASPY